MHNFQVSWLRLEQEIPVELEESFYWLLSSLEIYRFSFEHYPENTSTQTLFVWIPLNECAESDKENLIQSIASLTKPFNLTLPACKLMQIKDEDWSLSWKKSWKPDPIGKSILILPAWLDIPERFSKRKIIRLDPGSAFGTGNHSSTRLCIEALEDEPLLGKTIADLGCGSGILSLTALQLGAKHAFAVDTDSLAISATKINSNINKLPQNSLNIFLGSVEELEANMPKTKIDILLCNILAPVIKSLGPSFEKIVGCNGKVILSGLLVDQVKELQQFFFLLGWKVLEIRTKDPWALMVLIQKSP